MRKPFIVLVALSLLLIAPLGGVHGQSSSLDPLGCLLPPASTSKQYFGSALAAKGELVLVGAPGAPLSKVAGGAYLFNVTTGRLVHAFRSPTGAYYDDFGYAVAFAGRHPLVGAPQDHTGATDAGAAYLFDVSTGRLLRTLQSPTPTAFEWFGASLASVGGNVVVGASGHTADNTTSGTVYVFNGTTFALAMTLRSPSPVGGDHFGFSLGALGDDILVGAPGLPYSPGDGRDEAVYLFDGRNGSLLATFRKPFPEPGERFGFAVAAFGDDILIGAYRNSTGARQAGEAYLFNGTTGRLARTFRNPAPGEFDWFGESLAAIGNRVLIGASFDDLAEPSQGAVYVFNATTGVLEATLADPTPEAFEHFGAPIAGTGDKVLVGAPFESTTARDAGAVYVFGNGTWSGCGESAPVVLLLVVAVIAGAGIVAAVAVVAFHLRQKKRSPPAI